MTSLYPEVTKLYHLEPKHVFDEEYMNITYLKLFYKGQKITRVPDDLKVSAAQHMILAKIYKYHQWHNQGPYVPELDTHFKSVKALIDKGMILYQDKRTTLTDKGHEALCFQLLYASYKIDVNKAEFELGQIRKKLLDPSEATSLARVKFARKRTPQEDDEAIKEDHLRRALSMIFFGTTPKELAQRSREPVESACRLAAQFNKAHIETLIKRLKIKSITVQSSTPTRVSLAVHWHLLPYKTPQLLVFEVN